MIILSALIDVAVHAKLHQPIRKRFKPPTSGSLLSTGNTVDVGGGAGRRIGIGIDGIRQGGGHVTAAECPDERQLLR